MLTPDKQMGYKIELEKVRTLGRTDGQLKAVLTEHDDNDNDHDEDAAAEAGRSLRCRRLLVETRVRRR